MRRRRNGGTFAPRAGRREGQSFSLIGGRDPVQTERVRAHRRPVRGAGQEHHDFDLIESKFRHMMRVAVSVREGTISSSTLLKNLRSGSRKKATYTAFR
ncbi:Tn3 family transposase [Streptomyces sp. NPDC048272]|uniref:Tn3 family transposase n=1 Tax=Streptomyces sp. NPDC048272 TaxID=3154616 RepID=UPI003415A3F4